MTTLDKINELKEVALNEILNDDTLSRYSKLEQIEENHLWEIRPWIQHPFEQGYGKSFLEELKANPEPNGYVYTIMDDIMDEGCENRGQTVYLSCFFEEDNPEYYTPEEYQEWLDSKVAILTSRARPPRKMEITQKEFMDYLWNWALENKCCGWKFDW